MIDLSSRVARGSQIVALRGPLRVTRERAVYARSPLSLTRPLDLAGVSRRRSFRKSNALGNGPLTFGYP